jgi:hypothetical protein
MTKPEVENLMLGQLYSKGGRGLFCDHAIFLPPPPFLKMLCHYLLFMHLCWLHFPHFMDTLYMYNLFLVFSSDFFFSSPLSTFWSHMSLATQ